MKPKHFRRQISTDNDNRVCAHCGRPAFIAVLVMDKEPWGAVASTSETSALVYALCLHCCCFELGEAIKDVEQRIAFQSFIRKDFSGGRAIPVVVNPIQAYGLTVT